MKKIDVVRKILDGKSTVPAVGRGCAFAPSNIALCKYWGKRDTELNLPMTPSLSISLGDKGAETSIEEVMADFDEIILNEMEIPFDHSFSRRLINFLDLFRPNERVRYRVVTKMNIPVAAGLASSAAGFAALVGALNQLYGWDLDDKSMSVLARIGSGSAARSLWHGFVEWRTGEREDGLDSYAQLLEGDWPDLRVGLHLLSTAQKPLSSREAMLRTVQTSQLYAAWPAQVKLDLQHLKEAIAEKDFDRLGQISEANALAMHATMMSAWPPVIYSLPETITAMQQVWTMRAEKLPVYFTQDAGPNLKLLFPASVQKTVCEFFPNLEICFPFQR